MHTKYPPGVAREEEGDVEEGAGQARQGEGVSVVRTLMPAALISKLMLAVEYNKKHTRITAGRNVFPFICIISLTPIYL